MVFNKHNILNCNSVIVLCNFKRINPIEKLNLFHKRRRVIPLTSISFIRFIIFSSSPR